MSNRRRTQRFRKRVFNLFLLNLLIAALVYFSLDYATAIKHLEEDTFELLLILCGLSFSAAYLFAYWQRKESQLRQW
jgi:FtsH-binding integral membrane protein